MALYRTPSGLRATLYTARRRMQALMGPRATVVHRSERSILDLPDSLTRFPPYSALGRQRQATCSGVAWLPGERLAVVNLYGQHLRIYRLGLDRDGRPRGLELLHERDGVAFPETLAASADGRLLAICHSLSLEAGLSLQCLDEGFRPAGPARMLRIGQPGNAYHGIALSPDGSFLACGRIGTSACVELIRLSDLQPTWHRSLSDGLPGQPKAMGFTPDGRHLVIGHANLVQREHDARLSPACIAVHAFDADSGCLSAEPLLQRRLEGSEAAFLESLDIRALPGTRALEVLVSIQAADRIQRFELDLTARRLRPAGIALAGVSFAHGVSVSRDGAWLAATSYGADSLHVRALRR